MQKIELLAAKSDYEDSSLWLPFKVHSLDTAGIMELLYNKWLAESVRGNLAVNLGLDENGTREFCRLIALIHDIGKATAVFQGKIKNNIEGYKDILTDMGLYSFPQINTEYSHHSIAGGAILDFFDFPKEILVIICSHHGKGRDNYDEQLEDYPSNYYGRSSQCKEEWQNIWKEWVDFALNDTGFSVEELPKPSVKEQMILTGLLIMADWIASNTNYFPYIEVGNCLSDEECAQRVKNAWEKLSLPPCWIADDIYDLPTFFNDRFGSEDVVFTPNEVQMEMMENVSYCCRPGIYILEAPMGIGKTEAALASAEILVSKFNQNGIYFGLPTQATANGIFARIRDWAKKCDDEKHTIRLAHGMTELNEEYRELFHGRASDSGDENIFVHDWFEGKKQALLSDFVIATVDQFLLASLKQKHVMLRHLGLVGKVIIIDECHAYDAYMNEYLDNTLTWMGAYKVPVIILSATLPVKRRQELIEAYTKVYTDMNLKSCDSLAYPVLTWTDFDGVMQKEIKISLPDKFVSVNRINEEDMTDILKDKLSDGGCAAVIVNTVAYAQKLSEVIANEMPGYEVICFHSRFIATDRAKIEKELLERVGKNSGDKERNKLIVVGTQVLEQSLDIDFDYMITQLCPMDLLLQRCGRLHRHAKRIRPEKLEKAELAILKPSEDMNSVYSSWILKMTERYLPDELQIPQCISHLVNKVYEEPQTEEDINSEEYKEFEYVIKDKKYKAEKYCIVSDDLLKKRKNTIADFLQNVNNDADSEQAVRDIDETIEVLALCKNSDTLLDLVSGEISFDITKELSDEEAMLVAKERLRLPAYFSKNYNIKNTLNELEAVPKNWKNSKWLKGELLLILDENNDTELVHKKLHYSSARGLEYVKTE